MTEHNRRKILYVILALAIVWGGFNYPFGSKKRSPATAQTTAMTQTPTPRASSAGVTDKGEIQPPQSRPLTKAQIEILDNTPWPKDPFYKGRQKTKKRKYDYAKKYKLSAIMYNANSPSAFINGEIVSVGSSINGAKIISIQPKRVKLRVNGETFSITVK